MIDQGDKMSNLHTLDLNSIRNIEQEDFSSFDCLHNLRVLKLTDVDDKMLNIFRNKFIDRIKFFEVIYTNRDNVKALYAFLEQLRFHRYYFTYTNIIKFTLKNENSIEESYDTSFCGMNSSDNHKQYSWRLQTKEASEPRMIEFRNILEYMNRFYHDVGCFKNQQLQH